MSVDASSNLSPDGETAAQNDLINQCNNLATSGYCFAAGVTFTPGQGTFQYKACAKPAITKE